MLVVRIELLTGRYAATRFNDRSTPEWPPHPARLFSALVAAWADADQPDAAEHEVLEWLESLGAPVITASAAPARRPVTTYVPNNESTARVVRDLASSYHKLADLDAELADVHRRLADDPGDEAAVKASHRLASKVTKLQDKIAADSHKASARKADESDKLVRAGIELLPDERGRQGRVFPVAIPIDPVVWFSWPAAKPALDHAATLDRLLARVGRLGHSSSMVSCSVQPEGLPAPSPTHQPAPDGPLSIRVPGPGLLAALEAAHESHQGAEPRVLPAVHAPYRLAVASRPPHPRPHLGDEWVVLSDTHGAKLPATRSLDLTRAVRGALLRHADDPLPEVLSGHRAGPGETAASERPHLAVIALPFVGHPHADGAIRGVALVLPSDATLDERAVLAAAVRRWVAASGRGQARVTLGRPGVRHLDLGDQLSTVATLRPATWCHPSRRWVSVTPVALDRFPGELWSSRPDQHRRAEEHARESIAQACAWVGLPAPDEIEIGRAGGLAGVADLRRYPTYRSPGRGIPRACAHVRLAFAEPVQGPVLIGAGRYFGYGLFRPVDQTELPTSPTTSPAATGGHQRAIR